VVAVVVLKKWSQHLSLYNNKINKPCTISKAC